MFSLFHWTQAFFFFFFFSMKNEVYWDFRGSSLFWLYNIQDIESNFIRDENRSVCRAWPTWGAAAVFRSWPTRFLRDPSEDTAWGWDFEPLLICLFTTQWTVMFSFKSLHSSFREAPQWATWRSQKGMWLWNDLPEMGTRETRFCVFVSFGISIETLTQAFMGNYFLAQWITPWEKSVHLGGKKGTTILHKKRSK